MACMEHECRDCGHGWFDNRRATACPKCGSWEVSNWFDEDPSEHADYDYEEADAYEREPR